MKSVRTSRYSLSIVIGKYWKYLSTRWKKHATCATSINFQGCQLSNGEAWTRDRLCMKSSSFENMMASALSWALDGHGHGCYGSHWLTAFGRWECDAEDFKVETCLDNWESLKLQQFSFNFTRFLFPTYNGTSQGAKFRRCVIKLVMLDLGSRSAEPFRSNRKHIKFMTVKRSN